MEQISQYKCSFWSKLCCYFPVCAIKRATDVRKNKQKVWSPGDDDYSSTFISAKYWQGGVVKFNCLFWIGAIMWIWSKEFKFDVSKRKKNEQKYKNASSITWQKVLNNNYLKKVTLDLEVQCWWSIHEDQNGKSIKSICLPDTLFHMKRSVWRKGQRSLIHFSSCYFSAIFLSSLIVFSTSSSSFICFLYILIFLFLCHVLYLPLHPHPLLLHRGWLCGDGASSRCLLCFLYFSLSLPLSLFLFLSLL